MDESDKIFVAGHLGMLGSAMMRRLQAEGFSNIVTRDRSDLDLADESAVAKFLAAERPTIVIVAAARVGGIKANNDFPVEFLLENLGIQNNVIRSAYESGVRKLLFVGSACIYPKFAPQPIPETSLLDGPLEPTNEAYAIAKIAGIKLCQAYLANTGRISYRRCRRISTARTTISIWKHHTCCPRSCAKRMRPKYGRTKS